MSRGSGDDRGSDGAWSSPAGARNDKIVWVSTECKIEEMNEELTSADETHMDQVKIKQASICWWSSTIPATAQNNELCSHLKFLLTKKSM